MGFTLGSFSLSLDPGSLSRAGMRAASRLDKPFDLSATAARVPFSNAQPDE
jgi:hypothetical protein